MQLFTKGNKFLYLADLNWGVHYSHFFLFLNSSTKSYYYEEYAFSLVCLPLAGWKINKIKYNNLMFFHKDSGWQGFVTHVSSKHMSMYWASYSKVKNSWLSLTYLFLILEISFFPFKQVCWTKLCCQQLIAVTTFWYVEKMLMLSQQFSWFCSVFTLKQTFSVLLEQFSYQNTNI